MVGVDPGGPRIARAGEGADDALAVERGPEPLVGHVALDDVRDRRVAARRRAPRGRRRRAPRPRRGRARRRSTCRRAGRAAAVRGCGRTAPRTRGTRRRRAGESAATDAAVLASSCHWVSDVPSSNGVHCVGSTTKVRYPWRASSSSSMTSGCSSPTRYAHGLITKRSSANGRSSVHAPPSRSRRSSTSDRLAGAGQVRGGGQPVVAPADDHDVDHPRRLGTPPASTVRRSAVVDRHVGDLPGAGHRASTGAVHSSLCSDDRRGRRRRGAERAGRRQPPRRRRLAGARARGAAEPGGAVRSGELTEPGFVARPVQRLLPAGLASPVLRGARPRVARAAVVPPPSRSRTRRPTAAVVDPVARRRRDRRVARGLGRAGDGAWRELVREWRRVGDPFVATLLAPFPPVRAAAPARPAVGPRDLPASPASLLLRVGAWPPNVRRRGRPLLLAGNALHTDVRARRAGRRHVRVAARRHRPGRGLPRARGRRRSAHRRARSAGSKARGGTVRCGAPRHARRGARPARGRACGSPTATRSRRRAAVLADVGAPALYRDLVGEEHLPASLVADLERSTGTTRRQGRLGARRPRSRGATEPAGRAGTVHVARLGRRPPRVHGAQLATGCVPARPVRGRRADDDGRPDPLARRHRDGRGRTPTCRSTCAATRAATLTGEWDAGECGRGSPTASRREIERHAPGFRARSRPGTCRRPPTSQARRRQPGRRRGQRRHRGAVPAARLPPDPGPRPRRDARPRAVPRVGVGAPGRRGARRVRRQRGPRRDRRRPRAQAHRRDAHLLTDRFCVKTVEGRIRVRAPARGTVDGMRQCARPGCNAAAAATFNFDGLHRIVWLNPLAEAAAYSAGDLCRRHAERMTPPKDWELRDTRPELQPREPAGAAAPSRFQAPAPPPAPMLPFERPAATRRPRPPCSPGPSTPTSPGPPRRRHRCSRAPSATPADTLRPGSWSRRPEASPAPQLTCGAASRGPSGPAAKPQRAGNDE